MYQELCGSYSYCVAETTPNHSAEPSMYYSAIINTSIFTLRVSPYGFVSAHVLEFKRINRCIRLKSCMTCT